MRKPIRCFNLATLFLLTSMVLPASVVTSGTVTVLPNSGGDFNLTVNNTQLVSGNLLMGNWPIDRCSPCPNGTVISTSGQIVGNDFAGIWGSLNAAGPSFFEFTGPNVVLTLGLVQADFTFRGALCGVGAPVGNPIPCAINLPVLTGTGRVLLEVVPAFPGSADLRILSNSYVFTIPEPSFVILVGLALLGVKLSHNME